MRAPSRTLALLVVLSLLELAVPAVGRSARTTYEPCTGPDDWLRLVSSEWLRGDLRRLRDKSLEFKSDKLKKLNLKWKDVTVVCMADVARFVTEDGTTHLGLGTVADGTVTVTTGSGEVEFPRADLVAILPGHARELDYWRLDGSVGIDSHLGNTTQSAISSALAVQRETSRNRSSSGYLGSWGTAGGEKNVNKHRLEAKVDDFVTRRFYATLIESAATYDEFQNLALRLSPGSGRGYRLYDTPFFEWSVELGALYQYTKYLSVELGQPEQVNDWAGRVATYLKWDITSDWKTSFRYEALLVATNFDATSSHARFTVGYDITNLLKIEGSVINDRVRNPVPTPPAWYRSGTTSSSFSRSGWS